MDNRSEPLARASAVATELASVQRSPPQPRKVLIWELATAAGAPGEHRRRHEFIMRSRSRDCRNQTEPTRIRPAAGPDRTELSVAPEAQHGLEGGLVWRGDCGRLLVGPLDQVGDCPEQE